MTFEKLGIDNLLYRNANTIDKDSDVVDINKPSIMPTSGSTSSINIGSGEIASDLLVSGGFIRSFNYEKDVSGWTINSDGTSQFSDLTLTGGTLKYLKTSFSDMDKGYYIGPDGIYFGDDLDASFIKYKISDGVFTVKAAIDANATIGGRTASTLASAIDASGHFADSAINTADKTILGDFIFGVSGALQIGTYVNGTSGDLRISPDGILARDKNGDTTFSINGTTGVAVLNGLVVGTNVGLGTAQDYAGVTTIIGSTVTAEFINARNITAAYVNASISITTPTITGGTITIGTGNNIFKANSNGIYLGNATFASAPFSVDMAGNLKATSATITGAITTGSGSSLDAQYISSSTIVNTLTMGSASTTGYIQSYGWNGSANGFQLKGGTSPALTIIGGTITGTKIQTSSSSNTGIKMSSALGGMSVYGENINIYSTGGTQYGTIGSGGAYLDIASTSNRNIRIAPWSGSVYFGLNSGSGIAPTTSGQGNCGLSSQYWSNTYSNNYNFSTSYMNYENSGITTHTHFKPSSARSYNSGTSSYMWANVYADAIQISKSGYTTKYLTLNTSNNMEINTGLYVGGTLSKAAGTFTIDHPLKPSTHFLQHSFVESPDMLNVYRGNGNILGGECIIEMPDWFTPLNGNNKDDYSYQLTSIGQQNDLWVKTEMDNNKVVFAGEKDGKFSYIITAIRHDDYAEKNRIQIEVEKDFEKKQQYKDKVKKLK